MTGITVTSRKDNRLLRKAVNDKTYKGSKNSSYKKKSKNESYLFIRKKREK